MDEPTYQSAMTELREILAALQTTPTDIDRLHARVARAEQLIAECRSRLRQTEEALEKKD